MRTPYRRRLSHRWAIAAAVAATAFALAIGLLAGDFVAATAPRDKFSWAGLAFIPVWFLLELLLRVAAEVLPFDSKKARMPVAVALVLGFQIAWFASRSV
jgi:hypothetical protein